MSNTQQATYWILTIPHANFLPYLPPNCNYIKGQLELGNRVSTQLMGNSNNHTERLVHRSVSGQDNLVEESGRYLHWQLIIALKKKARLAAIRKTFGPWHAEPTRSAAANDYVWKDETAVAGTRFELGTKPKSKAETKDWEEIRELAKSGNLDNIPADVYVRNYNAIKRITADHLIPTPLERRVVCLWGRTGTGKSRRAWRECGMDAYPKDPRSKFWDGYRGHKKVVIDEFRGAIDISHMLRWLDRYPVIIEVKGSSTVLSADTIYITSNVNPEFWYPDLDGLTRDALLRRMEIFEMKEDEGFDETTNE